MTSDRPGNDALTPPKRSWVEFITNMVKGRLASETQAGPSTAGSGPVVTGADLAANWQAAKKEAIEIHIDAFRSEYPKEATEIEGELEGIFKSEFSLGLSKKLSSNDNSKSNEDRNAILYIISQYQDSLEKFFKKWESEEDRLDEIVDLKRSLKRSLEDIERRYRVVEPFFRDPDAGGNGSARERLPDPGGDVINVRNEDENRMRQLFRAFLALNSNGYRSEDETKAIDLKCQRIDAQLSELVNPASSGRTAAPADESAQPRTATENLKLQEKLATFFKNESDLRIFRQPDAPRIEAIRQLRQNVDELLSAAGFEAPARPRARATGRASRRALVEQQQTLLWRDLRVKADALISGLKASGATSANPRRTSGFRTIFRELVQQRFSDLRGRGVPESEALEVTTSATATIEKLVLQVSGIELYNLPPLHPMRSEYYVEVRRLEAGLRLEGQVSPVADTEESDAMAKESR